jgi:hypothetical protein
MVRPSPPSRYELQRRRPAPRSYYTCLAWSTCAHVDKDVQAFAENGNFLRHRAVSQHPVEKGSFFSFLQRPLGFVVSVKER